MSAAGRLFAYLWASPTTLVGLLLALPVLLTGGHWRREDGVLEVHGRWLDWLLRRCVPLAGGARAITFGHLVLGRDERSLAVSRRHERAHVEQCERWGPLFLPAYAVASLLGWWRHGDAYRGNAFERAAHEAEEPMRTARRFEEPPLRS